MTVYVTFLDYPIYSIAKNDNCLVTSGGGGGKNYGIEDLLEIHIFNEEEILLQTCFSSSEQGGVVDSITYSPKVNLWGGCLNNNIILFYFNDERGFVMLHKIPIPHNKPSSRQVVLRFFPSGDNLIVAGDDAVLKVWKLNIKEYPCKNNVTRQTRKLQGHYSPAVLFNDKPLEFIADLKGHAGEIKDCSISVDSRLAASCGADLTLRLWNLERCFLLHTQNFPNPSNKEKNLFFRCCRFLSLYREKKGTSLVYKLLAIGCGPRGPSYIFLWKICDIGESAICLVEKLVKIDQSACCSLAVSEKEDFFAIGFVSGEVKLLDNRFRLKMKHISHGLPVTGLCFLKKDSVLISSGADYSVAIMNLDRKEGLIKSFLRGLFYFLVVLSILLFLLDAFTVGSFRLYSAMKY